MSASRRARGWVRDSELKSIDSSLRSHVRPRIQLAWSFAQPFDIKCCVNIYSKMCSIYFVRIWKSEEIDDGRAHIWRSHSQSNSALLLFITHFIATLSGHRSQLYRRLLPFIQFFRVCVFVIPFRKLVRRLSANLWAIIRIDTRWQ